MAGMRNAIATGALGVLVGACGSGYREPPETIANVPAPAMRVEWAGEATVYDVLGRDATLIQAVQVPRRWQPLNMTARHPSPRTPFQVVTRCASAEACLDGVVRGDVAWLRPELTADDREILSEPGSWLERGVQIVHAEADQVSYYVALAHYTGGAAHSHATLSCHTQVAPDRRATLAILPPGTRADVIAAVDAFLAEAIASYDDRVRHHDEVVVDADFTDFLLDDDSLTLCFTDPWGTITRIRVELPVQTALLR
jgi:hypothetical protein